MGMLIPISQLQLIPGFIAEKKGRICNVKSDIVSSIIDRKFNLGWFHGIS